MSGRTALLFAVALTVFFSVFTLLDPPVLDQYLEALLADYRFKARGLFLTPRPPPDILIVAVDEQSLAEYGRWPWGRVLQATLLESILSGKPRALGLDVFHPESESADADRALGAVCGANRDRLAVALGFDVEKGKRFAGEIPEELYESTIPRVTQLRSVWPVEACRVLLPPAVISEQAVFGHVYSLPDRDGRLRWETLYLRFGEEFFPSLALQVARMALGVGMSEVGVVGGQGVRIGPELVPTDEFGRVGVNYYGPERTFSYLSAADVLAGRVLPAVFADKVVFVGTSAIATYDLKSTPFSANTPGVEKNATVVGNILRREVLRKAPLVVDMGFLLAIGCFLVLVAPRPRAVTAVGAFLCGVALLLLANFSLFVFLGVRANLLYPLGMLLLGGGTMVVYRYFREERRARQVRRIFSSYVTERVVSELIRNPQMARLGGERREVTVLFSDIRGFTTFSESRAPEEVVGILNEFLEAMTGVIFRWEGTLDKFVGDEIVAFWGAPLPQENHAELAVRCALDMLSRLGQLQEQWRARGKAPLDIGIGINTGEVIVGNIGAEGKKMEYTVIGDHVNLGARVEALTRKFEAHILTTEHTLARIRDPLQAGRLGPCAVTGLGKVIVKGKDRAVGLYEVRTLAPGGAPVLTECEEERVIRFDEK